MATVLLLVSSCLLILSSVDIAAGQRNGDLRLARFSSTSSSYSSGRLEIYINGQWGTVCDDFFTFTEATVACRQMGFTGSGSTTSISQYGTGSGQIWLDDVDCFGSESCLLSCSNRGIGVEDCTHFEDVAISCSGSRFTSTDCSYISTLTTFVNNIVGIAVGVSVACFVLFVVIPIIICVVVACVVVGGVGAAASSSSRHSRTAVVTTTPAPTTATVVTAGTQQSAYPQSAYPQPYPQSYPAAGTENQPPPPGYTPLPAQMSAYPPKGAYPPQGGYPPQ